MFRVLSIFAAWAVVIAPPQEVKSWAKQYTAWPFTVPLPATALPSLRRASISTKLPASKSLAARSRAVLLPSACCLATRSASPARIAAFSMARACNFSDISNPFSPILL